MRHLSSEQLVDLAEGIQREPSVVHLQSCDACRRRLADVRATMAAVGELNVPEPSPLFWDYLSRRVEATVKTERVSSGIGHWSWLSARPVWAGAFAIVVFAIALATRSERSSRIAGSPTGAALQLTISDDLAALDDPSLSLVADLAEDLDWEGAREAGLTTHVGVDDDAVSQLSDSERHELHELLKGELTRPGA